MANKHELVIIIHFNKYFLAIFDCVWPTLHVNLWNVSHKMDYLQQAKEMVMELIRDQGFREQRGEYGSRVGGGETLDVSKVSFLRDRPFWAVTSLWAFSSSRFRFHGLQLELSSAEAERWSKRSRATRGSESSLNQVSNHHHLKCLLRNVGQWLKLMHHADKLMDHLTLLFWDRSPTMSRKGKEKENTIPHLLVLAFQMMAAHQTG